ncbi:hypothetical protein AVEN_20799-1 [Araneus ventricosus]|uniref:Uncharacterized protein n=1 Tax=Araneus ventricosus TaxID=182803 RepID=A0A4Y2R1M5_ARAVE|nr:hypothetical protein AVEN_236526-1 [Araneus ventricosus]GBN69483.1 hypothetical protein AVEN_20799-1 [Araneus ventricosus]
MSGYHFASFHHHTGLTPNPTFSRPPGGGEVSSHNNTPTKLEIGYPCKFGWHIYLVKKLHRFWEHRCRCYNLQPKSPILDAGMFLLARAPRMRYSAPVSLSAVVWSVSFFRVSNLQVFTKFTLPPND